MATFKPLVTEL